ncbi:hypothetical protein WS71_09535 [Burkholderia mayonis]|uniref:Uncharacterized protein n=1 Tax=Burkholderia mayonis TaxID=1385591 RepID=A0A1B4FV56_9BURK|nr:hypothetical protein WS71_09535 [Burkholderia mayonis]KVE50912.1 hypothetical protein WS71_13625 [Burkholderia mayonis]
MAPAAVRTGAPPTASPHAERLHAPTPQHVGHASGRGRALATRRGGRADATGRHARGRLAQRRRNR